MPRGPWNTKGAVLGCAAGCFLALCAIGGEVAYREEIVTPHWDWAPALERGTIWALVLTNALAVREPEELAQRFDLRVTVLPVKGGGDLYTCDNDRLMAGLSRPYDVIILASSAADRALTAENRQALWNRVKDGTPLVMYWQSRLEGNFAALLKRKGLDSKDGMGGQIDGTLVARLAVPPGVTGLLPTDTLSFRGGKLAIQGFSIGKGRLLYVAGYDTHWTWFHAFLPSRDPYFDNPLAAELYYAVAARTIGWAAGKEAAARMDEVRLPSEPSAVGQPATAQCTLSGDVRRGDTLEWFLYAPGGQQIDAGRLTLAAGQTAAPCTLTPKQAGNLLCRWRLERGQKALDFGAFYLPVSAPAALAAVTVPESIPAEAALDVIWQVAPAADGGDEVLVRVSDPDDRLVSVGRAKAGTGHASLPGWIPRAVTHQVDVCLLRNGLTLDAKRVSTQVRWDRAADLPAFHVIAWATEQGSIVERNRLRLLRDLGITALTTGGKNLSLPRLASEEGLRIVPTNIYVPANARKRKFDPQAEEKALEAYVASVAKYRALGYSLADEPNTSSPSEFRDRGAEIIHRNDAGAYVGFCGVWQGFDRNVPEFFAHCDFVEAYSPFHLYTPNLWLGNERDLYRSFRRPGSIVTCWTHYAPWADHEPYSRTVPWLWLFEGLNGVSYFDTGGEFAILPPDMRSTHETRWWSDEVRQLQRGIGQQIIALRREAGGARILFSQGATGADQWARAFNEAHVPYRFASRSELVSGLDASVRLLICPGVEELSAAEYAALESLVRRGSVVVATSPLGLLADGKAAAADRLGTLFGVARTKVPADAKEWAQQRAPSQGIPAVAAWPTEGLWAVDGAEIAGRTLGETRLALAGGTTLASYRKVGEMGPGSAGQPDFVQAVFATPAAVQQAAGKGKTLYCTFQPEVASLRAMAPMLLRQAGIAPLDVRVTAGDRENDTVYPYPLSDGTIRLLGIVQDYWRAPPADQLDDDKETVGYFNHGPSRWQPQPAELVLDRPAFLYDVRRSVCLGRTTRAKLDLQPGRPELFAMLPYEVAQLAVAMPSQAAAGQILQIGLTLTAAQGAVGDHVVYLAMTDPAGRQTPADRYTLQTRKGQGRLRVQIPFNAPAGAWKVTASDAVTGISSQQTLIVTAGPDKVPPTRRDVEVRRLPVPWPAGNWVPYRPPTPDATKAAAKITPLQRRQYSHVTGHQNHQFVTAGATLSNADIAYNLRYEVCNDAKAHGWDDPRHIWAAYPPGLGFNKPNPNSWYYNGYLEILLDSFRATNYVLSELATVEDGANARVRAVFDTPKAKVTLVFALMPDHPAIFQEMVIQAAEPIAKATVQFRSFPAGFGAPAARPFVTIEPARKAWALMGDEVNEPAYGRGSGACAILVLPEELETVKYEPRITLVKAVNLKPGQQAAMHWALWTFPKTSNAVALSSMRESEADNRGRLVKLFGAPAAKR